MLGRAHIGPYDARLLDRRVVLYTDLRPHRAVFGLRRQVDAVAVDVERPAVIDAADAAFLNAAVKQRRAPMRAIGIDQPDPAVTVAERDQILGE